jgi:hypothetical protein
MEKGVLTRVRLAIQQIEGHLELHPITWGDISHHLRKLQISVYNRIHDELSVTYAVHDTERVVWLTRIAPILGHPLGV